MFFSAAHSAVYFARRTVFTTLCKQARFLSVSAVSSTKNFYSESVLFSEKPSKSAKARKNNGKKLEQSQLYSDELEKLHNCDFEEFDLLMDDETPSIQKDPRSGKLESEARKFEAVDKMPSMQEGPKSGNVESVARKFEAVDKMPSMKEGPRSGNVESVARKFEAVDKMPSMQEVQRSVRPDSMARKFEAVEGLKFSETEEIDLQENDLSERLSDNDSESESEAEDYFGTRKKVSNNFQHLNKLKIARLGRRSIFFREKMEMANLHRDELILNDEINGIFALSKLGLIPETLFFCSFEALKYFPGDLSNTALYIVPFEDMKYWSFRVRTPETAMIGVYKREDFKSKASSSEPEVPLTLICDQIWHRLGFAEIINSAYVSPPKHFISSKDCAFPWHGVIVRNSLGHGALLNHDFGLTWEEIRQKVNENDRVYLLELSLFREEDEAVTESHWSSSLPSVYLYNHNFWDSENITLIVTRRHSKRASQELSTFCSERNASRIDPGLTKRSFGLAAFQMVFFELRRQWLAAESRNLSENGLKNGKTAKSRVRIVSTLFKT